MFELVGSVSEAPLHIGPGLVNVGVTLAFTVTVATAELWQLPDVPVTVTVYEFPATTLELDVEKLTLLPVPDDRYVVGLQENEVAVVLWACNMTDDPLHTDGLFTEISSCFDTFIIPLAVAGEHAPLATDIE